MRCADELVENEEIYGCDFCDDVYVCDDCHVDCGCCGNTYCCLDGCVGLNAKNCATPGCENGLFPCCEAEMCELCHDCCEHSDECNGGDK